MKYHYFDIRSRIGVPPAWWDEKGVPRYDVFVPFESGNPFAREVVLLETACQSCDRHFKVCMTTALIDMLMERPLLKEQIDSGMISYGDPPNVGCCSVGHTMNCDNLRVLEYWRRRQDHEPGASAWLRDSDFERELPDALRKM